MRKRFLSLLCVLALCLGLLPVTALAAGEDAPGTLWVGRTQITARDYWKTTTEGNLETGSENDYNVYYDGNGTLTLNGATIQGGTSTGSVPYGAGIYAQCSNGQSVTLTIKLIGENTITGYYGIYVNAEISADSNGTDASLTITGENNGSLEVSGSNHGIFVKSGTGNASLNIEKATVTSSTNGGYAAGVYVQSGVNATGSPNISLSVNGGSLTASGTGNSDGILFYVGQSQATGATTSLTITDHAIVDARNGGISASRISETLPTPTPTGNNSSGIVFDDKNGTVYGNVTLDESLTINQGETLTVPDGSSLNCNGNLTNNGTIIVEKGGNLTGNPGGTVVSAPTIGTQPASQTVTKGNTATFSVAATGEKLSYQWQRSTDNGQSWTDISEAKAATYNTAATTTSMNGYQYRCVVSNSAGSVTSDAATLTVSEPAPITYTINADVTPSGAGTATANKTTAAAGDTVTLTATANPGYRFTSWTSVSGGTFANSSSANTTFTMPAGDVTVTANFVQVYTVTVSSMAGGTATADKTTAAEGETVTLTATPDSGYHFDGWRVVSGTVTIQDNKFTMPAGNVEIQAIFDRNSSGGASDPTYSITLPSRVTGGELKLSRRYAEKGETVTLTAIPDKGYELDTLTVTDSKGKEIELTHKGGNEYTFKMPAGRVEIEVSFREIAVELHFTDVPEGAWYEDAAAYVYNHGLMAGTSATTFAPDATTSRSMIATILWRMAGSPVVNYAMDYTDVAQGQWYSEAIRWAASEGIVGGYGNGLFGTNDPITREQFAVMLYRFAQEQGYDVSIGESTNILSYTDVADLSEYAISAMQWAVGAGIINGTGDGSTLSPQGQATRAQAAVMLMRFCEEYVTW